MKAERRVRRLATTVPAPPCWYFFSEIIKDKIITIHVCNTNYYDGHGIPLPATLLKTIKKRKYISEDLDLTYRTAQKGLTILRVALLDEDEILSINKPHKYISGASLTSPEGINKTSILTSNIPNTMKRFTDKLKVFTNLLYALFTTSCPLLLKIKEIIRLLKEYKPAAQVLIKK